MSLVVASIFAAIGIVGLVRIRDFAAQQEHQYRANVVALSHMTDGRSAVGSQLEAVVSHILSEPGYYRDQYELVIRETDQRLDTDLVALDKMDLARSEAGSLHSFEALLKLWRAARDTALEASRNGDRRKATSIVLIRSAALASSVKARADAVLTQLVDSVAAGARASLASIRATERLMLLSLVAGAIVAITLSVLAGRTMSRPIRDAVEVLSGVGRGDFTQRLSVRGTDEVGQMGQALNETLVRLRDAFAGLKYEAYHDNLTGLPNRAMFRELLTEAFMRCRRGSRAALLLIDLDGFKQVNDTHGHGVGDQLLIAVAERLSNGLQGPDDIAVRLGGDEFAVLLDGFEDPSNVYEVADRLLASIGDPLTLPEAVLMPRASIGVALWLDHPDIDALVHDADLAMYAAKAAGKNAVVRFDQMEPAV